jgi:hypothetical protein
VPTTAFYRRLLRRLAAFLGCEPTEAAVLRERGRRETIDLVGALLLDANIEMLLVDRGYPPGDLLPDAGVEAAAACRIQPLLRLEPLLEGLVARHGSLSDVAEALRQELGDVRARGFAGLESIVAYRTGLDIETLGRRRGAGGGGEYDSDRVAATILAAAGPYCGLSRLSRPSQMMEPAGALSRRLRWSGRRCSRRGDATA